jgi:hypothetical protein
MARSSCHAVLLVVVLCLGCGRTSLHGDAEDRPCADSPCAPAGLYPGSCVEEHRVGADLTVQSRTVYSYDDMCLISRAEHDFDGDGEVQLTVSYVHDERGLLISETRSHATGSTEIWTYMNDEAGNQILVEAGRSDGVIDYWIEYERNERGDVLEERAFSHDELSGWTVYTYDAEGGVVTVEEHQHFCIDWMVFTGEIVSRRTTYTNDGAGRVTVEVDGVECVVADGVIDIRIERTFDSGGNLLVETVDGDTLLPGPPDGVLDSCTTYEYDAHGRRVRIEWDGVRGTCDGVPDNIAIHAYDDEGREVRLENDYYADGDLDEVFTYEYDPCGNRLLWSAWRASEDRTVWTQSFGYDCWD